jgi:hypothetical protein
MFYADIQENEPGAERPTVLLKKDPLRISDIGGIPTLRIVANSNHNTNTISAADPGKQASRKALTTRLADMVKKLSRDISLRRQPGLEVADGKHPWETAGEPAVSHGDALKVWKNFASEFRKAHPELDENDEQMQANEAWKQAHRKHSCHLCVIHIL